MPRRGDLERLHVCGDPTHRQTSRIRLGDRRGSGGFTAARLSQRREQFLAGGQANLKARDSNPHADKAGAGPSWEATFEAGPRAGRRHFVLAPLSATADTVERPAKLLPEIRPLAR